MFGLRSSIVPGGWFSSLAKLGVLQSSVMDADIDLGDHPRISREGLDEDLAEKALSNDFGGKALGAAIAETGQCGLPTLGHRGTATMGSLGPSKHTPIDLDIPTEGSSLDRAIADSTRPLGEATKLGSSKGCQTGLDRLPCLGLPNSHFQGNKGPAKDTMGKPDIPASKGRLGLAPFGLETSLGRAATEQSDQLRERVEIGPRAKPQGKDEPKHKEHVLHIAKGVKGGVKSTGEAEPSHPLVSKNPHDA